VICPVSCTPELELMLLLPATRLIWRLMTGIAAEERMSMNDSVVAHAHAAGAEAGVVRRGLTLKVAGRGAQRPQSEPPADDV